MRPLALVAVLALPAVVGCASTNGPGGNAVVASATGLPDHFLVGSPSGNATAEPRPGEGCRTPMVDARDGTRLALDRSANGVGDYIVPGGRYGVPRGERLRLDCATGRPIGRVRR